MVRLLLFAVLISYTVLVAGDIYMHNPRGSNNRLNEQTNNRNNGNRLFDSQNNNEGGYNVGDLAADPADAAGGGIMKYHANTQLWIEVTAQHGCGINYPKSQCDIIIQYMCDDTATSTPLFNQPTPQASGMHDGTTTTTVTTAAPDSPTTGRHEPIGWWENCKARDRNKGLFLADQDVTGNDATFTRQNPNGKNDGNRNGFECPEERDYWPYWHPTPWVDIAVLTWNTSMCSIYKANSNNVKEYGLCFGNPAANNPTDCTGGGGVWTQYSHGKPAPDCQPAPWSRDNHLGNVDSGDGSNEMMRYKWTIPISIGPGNGNCVLRVRYNMTSSDYWGYDTNNPNAPFADASLNGDVKSPVQDNPTIDVGILHGVKLAHNTNQVGRTFEDRSHVFQVLSPAPQTVWNINVRGRRGNIVDVFPAIEYDFVPNDLSISAGDLVHFQWTGSLLTPDGTDKNNIVQISDLSVNQPMNLTGSGSMFQDLNVAIALASVGATGAFDSNLADRPAYYDGGLVALNRGTWYYMCTRNNNFSNRSQKGRIIVR